MNTVQSKIQKTAKTVYVAARITEVVLWVTAAAALIGTIVMGVYADKLTELIASGNMVMQQGGVLTVSQPVVSVAQLMAQELTAFIAAIAGGVVMHMVCGIFKRIKTSDSPFNSDIVKKLKVLAIVSGIMIGVSNSLMLGLIVGFAIYSISVIFDYGAQLQQQADETI